MTNENKKPVAILIGANGNTLNLASICVLSLKKANYSEEQIQSFKNEIYSSKDYNEALSVMHKWCEVQ